MYARNDIQERPFVFNSLFWSEELVPHETLSVTVLAALLHLYSTYRLAPPYPLRVAPSSPLADGHTCSSAACTLAGIHGWM